MNWQQAIETLSAQVAKKYKIPNSEALKEAVQKGLEWELTAWCNQTR